jgi:DNA adenine methylase
MVNKLLPLFPEHRLYCEPFCGGAATFWAKPPSEIEVINDLNGEVSNFYQPLRDDFEELQRLINSTLFSRSDYFDALHVYQRPHMFAPVKRAWAFYVVTNQGWGGKIGTWGYGVGDNKREGSLSRKKDAFTASLQERLKIVQVECNDALKVIKSRDREFSFFYIDPPYYNSCMGHYDGYTAHDFEQLLQLLGTLKGKFLLSSYPSELLSTYSKQFGWYQKAFDMHLSVGNNGKRKVEVVTANYPI